MKTLILAATASVLLCGSALAADHPVKRHVSVQPPPPPPPEVYFRPEPLRQIPIVGTVVYGGLDYAGALILSPTELFRGPPPPPGYYR